MSDLMLKMYCNAKASWYMFKNQERGAINFVEIAIILAIVMVIAMFFREQIYSLIERLFDDIGAFDAHEGAPGSN